VASRKNPARSGARIYTRSLAEELRYLREHLDRSEVEILAAALRRGVFETFKGVVLKQYAAGEIGARQAEALLGEKVFRKISEWLPDPAKGGR
jgi:hypothetical protein